MAEKTPKHETANEINRALVSVGPCFLAIILIFLCGVLAYKNSLRAPFIIDDYYTIARNFPLRDLSRIGEILGQNLFASAGQASSYFRPLTQVTFAFEYQLWGLNPAGYRATNIGLHVINSLLVFFLAQRWFALWPASFVGLLFAVHPVNVQAIAYISSRSDPLFFFFSILTMYFWTANKAALRPLCWLSFLLALFSKETAVVTPVLVLLTDLILCRSLAEIKVMLGRKWQAYLGFLLAFLVYLIIRLWLLGYPLLMETEIGLAALGERFLLAAKLLGKYLLLLFYPIDLAFHHTVPAPKELIDGAVIGPVLLIILFGYLGAKLWHRDRAVIFGLSWFLVGILPVLNLTRLNLPMMESWLYLPEVGFFIMTAALGRQIFAAKEVSLIIGCFLVLLLSVRTMVRSADWKNPIRLFESNVKLYPDAHLAWLGLSAAYGRANRQNDSFEALKKARDLRPNHWPVHMSLAMHYFYADQDDQAREAFLTTLRLKPDHAWAHYWLGILNLRSGRWPQALQDFENALSGKPHIPMLYHVIGSAQLALARNEAAGEAFQTALKDSPSRPEYHAGIHIELGRLLKERGNVQGAKREFELAIKFNPGDSQAKAELTLLQKER